jgi:hypothetical protein
MPALIVAPSSAFTTHSVPGGLPLLRQHPIFRLEVASGVGDELPVTGVIDGFHTDDNLHQRGIVLADVLDQFGLGIGRPRDENRTGVCDRLRDSLKEGVILPGMPAPDGVCLMVDVLGRMIGVQHESFYISRAEMEHACFMVIDPNDGEFRTPIRRRHESNYNPWLDRRWPRRPRRSNRICRRRQCVRANPTSEVARNINQVFNDLKAGMVNGRVVLMM